MKLIYTSFFTLLFTLTSLNNFSQEIQSCGTQTSVEDLQFINDNMDLIRYYENEYYNLKQTKSSTALTSIPRNSLYYGIRINGSSKRRSHNTDFSSRQHWRTFRSSY